MTKQRKTWTEFKRRTSRSEFWGCLNSENEWFDTGWDFATALYWCRMDSGEWGPEAMTDTEWFAEYAPRLGYKVVSHLELETLYNDGLVS